MTKIISLFFFLVSISCSPQAAAQSDLMEIPVTFADGIGDFAERFITSSRKHYLWMPERNPRLAKIVPKLKGIPADWKEVHTEFIWFDINQFVYQKFKEGKCSKADYDSLSKLLYIDVTKRLYSSEPLNCFVAIVAGKNKAGEEKYKIDRNHNLNFADDKIRNSKRQTAHLTELYPNDGKDSVQYETLRNGKVIKRIAPLIITYNDNDLFINIPEHIEAELEGKTVHLSSAGFASTNYDYSEMVLVQELLGRSYKDVIFESKFFTINEKIYKFIGVDINRQVLKVKRIRKDTIIYDTHVGLYAPPISGQNLEAKPVSLADYKGKYLLLEFWSTADQSLFYLQNYDLAFWRIDRKKIDFLTMVNVDQKDLAGLPGSVTKYRAEWQHVVINERKDITRQYGVYEYPTNFLIGPEGKIIIKNIWANDSSHLFIAYPERGEVIRIAIKMGCGKVFRWQSCNAERRWR